MISLIEGLFLGFAYVMPIGAQNLFVIQSALNNNAKDSFKISSYVVIMDISLALACFFGIGFLVQSFPLLAILLQFLGGLYLIKLAYTLFKTKSQIRDSDLKGSGLNSLRNAFVMTWFNPQAIIDGSILLGSFRNKIESNPTLFISGVCLASLLWFYSLTIIIKLIQGKLKDNHLKAINVICATVLLYFGAALAINAGSKMGTLWN